MPANEGLVMGAGWTCSVHGTSIIDNAKVDDWFDMDSSSESISLVTSSFFSSLLPQSDVA